MKSGAGAVLSSSTMMEAWFDRWIWMGSLLKVGVGNGENWRYKGMLLQWTTISTMRTIMLHPPLRYAGELLR